MPLQLRPALRTKNTEQKARYFYVAQLLQFIVCVTLRY